MAARRGVECSPGFLLLVGLLALLDEGGVLPWAAAAAGVHELGHYIAVRIQGGRVARLRLTLSGGALELDGRRPLTYAGELAAILAGPGASLLLAWWAAGLGEKRWVLAGLSLCLGWFNLLPVWPLDGGRVLLLILSGFLPHSVAEVWIRRCSLALGAGLLAGGGSLLLRGGSPTLLLMGVWLTLCQLRGEK